MYTVERLYEVRTASLPVMAIVLYGKVIAFVIEDLWKLWFGLMSWKTAHVQPTDMLHTANTINKIIWLHTAADHAWPMSQLPNKFKGILPHPLNM